MSEAANKESPASLSATAFTPLLAPLSQAVAVSLAETFGLPIARWEDRILRRPEDSWAVLFETESGLTVELSAPTQRSFVSGPVASLSYRKLKDGREASSVEPFRSELAQLRACVEALTAEDAQPIFDRLAHFRAFSATDDFMFVQANPTEVVLRLGFRCNQDCGFCWQARTWPDAPIELVRLWIAETIAAGHTRIVFSGGEPTIFKALPEAIALARAGGLEVILQTNAVRVAKASYLATLVEAGLSGAFVSFHSGDIAVSDVMTRAPRTHVRTVQGVRNMLAAGLTVELNCVVELRNYERLAHHASTIVEQFVTPFPENPVAQVSYSQPCESFDSAIFDETLIALDLVKPHLVDALRTLTAAGVRVSGIGTCGFPPCLLAEAPELLTWIDPDAQHEQDVSGRVYPDACSACSKRAGCLGLRFEYTERLGDRGITPFA